MLTRFAKQYGLSSALIEDTAEERHHG